jgi:hypothetical protein
MGMTNESLASFNLRMLNLWIGLCRGAAGLPKELRKLGYQDKAIEFAFNNSKNEAVVPELIACSRPLKHTMLLEWKSGNNTDDSQLKRYANVTSADIRGRVAAATGAHDSHDVVVVGEASRCERLEKGLSGKYSFPLLGVDSSGIALRLNTFVEPRLARVFSPKLQINESRWPVSFVPFESTSPLWVVAESVIPAVLESFHSGDSVLLLNALLPEVVDAWNIMSDAEQKRMRTAVQQVITAAARRHFSRFLKRNREYERTRRSIGWDIVNNPLDLTSSRKSREFRRLKTLQFDFIEHLRTGKDNADPEQLNVFDDGVMS